MRTKYIEPEIVDLIRQHLNVDEWLSLWIAAETGMRIGDILALRVCDVSMGVITYRAQKTAKRASVTLSGALGRAVTAKAELECRNQQSEEAWLFPSPRDPLKHLTRQAAWYRVKRACRRADVDAAGIAPHSFRKYFAVELFKREGLEATRAALQHDRSSTTEIYALSDFTSGEAAYKPLLRRDLPLIVREVLNMFKTSLNPSFT